MFVYKVTAAQVRNEDTRALGLTQELVRKNTFTETPKIGPELEVQESKHFDRYGMEIMMIPSKTGHNVELSSASPLKRCHGACVGPHKANSL